MGIRGIRDRPAEELDLSEVDLDSYPFTWINGNKAVFVVNDGPPMSAEGVRRDKAALSSGCEPHPANAPAGSNRSSHGGNEVGLKPSISVSRIGDSASVQTVTRVNAEQSSKRTMRRPTRQPFRGRLIPLGEQSEEYAQPLRRGSDSMYTRKAYATREAPWRGQQ
jgi:hypothetical protein